MKALSHDMTWANANIWNYGMKSPDDIPSKSLNPMRLEGGKKTFGIYGCQSGFPTADVCNDVDFDVVLSMSFRACTAGEQIFCVNETFSVDVSRRDLRIGLQVNLLGLVHGLISSLNCAAGDAGQQSGRTPGQHFEADGERIDFSAKRYRQEGKIREARNASLLWFHGKPPPLRKTQSE